MLPRFLLAAGAALLAGAAAARADHPRPTSRRSAAPTRHRDASQAVEPVLPPPAPREFRGVWVASVGNLDWPSRPGLSTEQQQAELLALLDRAASLHLNAVVLQVRPACDALYRSSLEPWSEFLSGTMGQPPVPYYDPLAFAVREAHRRGLELHAWFNPFRARYAGSIGPASPDHVSRLYPEIVRPYGRSLWLDPGEPVARRRAIRVILDVVHRYDVDGVHIDDYFYPYRERDSTGTEMAFPDSATYARYRAGGGALALDDWRRANVDGFVRDLYGAVKKEKRWVKFGVSPFGIWRPGHPASIAGLDAYDELYADSRKWLTSGWLDYLSPQLYWPIEQQAQSFPVLLRWWTEQNTQGRHLWPGLYTARVGGDGGKTWAPGEIVDQVTLTRAQPGAGGNMHFSMRSFLQDYGGLDSLLVAGPYAEPALVPASPWLDRAAPPTPKVVLRRDAVRGLLLRLRPGVAARPWLWAVRLHVADGWRTLVVPGVDSEVVVAPSDSADPAAVWVQAVGRTGNASGVVLAPRAATLARSARRGR